MKFSKPEIGDLMEANAEIERGEGADWEVVKAELKKNGQLNGRERIVVTSPAL